MTKANTTRMGHMTSCVSEPDAPGRAHHNFCAIPAGSTNPKSPPEETSGKPQAGTVNKITGVNKMAMS